MTQSNPADLTYQTWAAAGQFEGTADTGKAAGGFSPGDNFVLFGTSQITSPAVNLEVLKRDMERLHSDLSELLNETHMAPLAFQSAIAQLEAALRGLDTLKLDEFELSRMFEYLYWNMHRLIIDLKEKFYSDQNHQFQVMVAARHDHPVR